MELLNLDLWTNLILIFGSPALFLIVLSMLFIWYGVKADINKWTMISFLLIFLFWIGSVAYGFIAALVLIVVGLVVVEAVRRLLGER